MNATMAHVRWGVPWACNDERVSRDHSDGFVEAMGSVWMSVIDVECQNACFKVEHDLF